jgi:N-acylglucosamine-6-phosphate 2-epimerase
MSVLDDLRGGLIVSVQADPSSPLNTPEAIALLCRVAVINGAVAVRVEGLERVPAAVRAVAVPVIGIVKRTYDGFAPYITAGERELAEVAATGAAIVAFDATGRPRPDGRSVADVVAAIHARGLLAMADCATDDDVRAAAAAGADAVSTTLCGYTDATRHLTLPALELTRACSASGRFAICEGGVANADDVAAAFAAGADAVVAGTALTNIDVLVRRFAAAAPGVRSEQSPRRSERTSP